MDILKHGSRGKDVENLQEFLGLHVDGVFGKKTLSAVLKWQGSRGLKADGIVGPKTWDAMGLASTDESERSICSSNGLLIHKHYLPEDEYCHGQGGSEYIFLHHTAGWNSPYKTINNWGRDRRGRVATEFVLGGQKLTNGDDEYDGTLVQAFPEGNYAWHLGKNGSQYMHKHSTAIEVNNFGQLTKGGYRKKLPNGKRIWVDKDPNRYYAYQGSLANESQIVTLDKEFRGYKNWHRYTDAQIEILRDWIIFIGERDGIDIRKGLPELVREYGANAFEFNEDAYYGKVKGVWTHTNTRKDKFDMFPQEELMDMLVSL